MPENVHIKIRGQKYRARNIDEIALHDIFLFDEQADAAGLKIRNSAGEMVPVDFDGVQAMFGRSEDEPMTTKEALIVSALVAWLTLRAAGEDITFAEAARIPPSEIENVEDESEDPKEPDPSSSSPDEADAEAGPLTNPSETSLSLSGSESLS